MLPPQAVFDHLIKIAPMLLFSLLTYSALFSSEHLLLYKILLYLYLLICILSLLNKYIHDFDSIIFAQILGQIFKISKDTGD